jgi:hypothetical protein
VTTEIIGRDGFARLVHAEWTKFRTVRGWVITMIVAIGATVAVGLLGSDAHCSVIVPGRLGGSACTAFPTGPGGEAVQDAFYFAHQPLTGNGTITVQTTSLTGQLGTVQGPGSPVRLTKPGLQPWSRAGIIIKQDTSQGSAYAAMMVTGSNGVRMQWDYVNDIPGITDSVRARAWCDQVSVPPLAGGCCIGAAQAAVLADDSGYLVTRPLHGLAVAR